MKYRFLIAVVVAVIMLGSVAAQTPQVGLVLGVQGEGQLERNGEARELRIADTLFAGDRLQLNNGSASFLFCPTGQMVTVSEGTRLLLQESGYTVESGAQPSTREGRQCTLPRVALGAESLERVGGLRARGFPPIVVFVGGNLSSARPTFEWKPVPEADRYEIQIKDPRGRMLLEAEARQSGWQPPEDLAPGSYQWEILAYKDSESIGRQIARFTIKPADLGDPGGNQTEDLLLHATTLENEGYYAEAAAIYRKLREMFPEDERMTRRLVWLYWNSGLITAASEENQKLESGG